MTTCTDLPLARSHARTHARSHEPHARAGPGQIKFKSLFRGGRVECRNFPGLYSYPSSPFDGVEGRNGKTATPSHFSPQQTSLSLRTMKQFAATMKSHIRSLVPLVALLLLSWTTSSVGQEKPASAWIAHDLQFRVLNTTASSDSLWICGTDEAIAGFVR